MFYSKTLVLKWVVALAVLVVALFYNKESTASFDQSDLTTYVSIGNVDYGSFKNIKGLDKVLHASNEVSSNEIMLNFNRDFVTDPSLYNWAKLISEDNSKSKIIYLKIVSSSGELLKTLRLGHVQPLSWSLKVAKDTQSGFNESVDLVVQDAELY